MNFLLYLAAILVVFGISYTLGYMDGLQERPTTVPCEVEIPAFTKGETAFRLTTCTLREE